MFGYIRPSPQRLSEEESARFRAVYCGLCHTLGKRYGFLARFVLNFDFTFLSILLSGGTSPPCAACRCAVHPCKARCVVQETPALTLAADRSIILAWWQLRDHIRDHGFFGGLKYRLASLFLRRAYRKARALAPEFDDSVQRRLRELAAREQEHCDSIDAAAEPFAALMADIADCETDEKKRRILRQIFYHLGRWIYLVDAADDYSADARSGCYNPLRYRYHLTADKLDEATKRALGETLDRSIAQMAGAYALWDYGVWTPILDSIFYESFYGIGKAVLDGIYRKPPAAARFRNKMRKFEETV